MTCSILNMVLRITGQKHFFKLCLLVSERSERETIRGVQTRAGAVYLYIHICVWKYVCHNSSACHAYVMWVELGNCNFLYVPAVLNIVTTGNGIGIKNVVHP